LAQAILEQTISVVHSRERLSFRKDLTE